MNNIEEFLAKAEQQGYKCSDGLRQIFKCVVTLKQEIKQSSHKDEWNNLTNIQKQYICRRLKISMNELNQIKNIILSLY